MFAVPVRSSEALGSHSKEIDHTADLSEKYLAKLDEDFPWDRTLALRVIRAMEETGKSLKQLCLEPGMPTRMQFTGWVARHPGLQQLYDQARTARADHYFERMDDLYDEVKSGAIAPDVAKVLLDTTKWMAATLNRKRYGKDAEPPPPVVARQTNIQINVNDPTEASRAYAQFIDQDP